MISGVALFLQPTIKPTDTGDAMIANLSAGMAMISRDHDPRVVDLSFPKAE